MRVLFNMSYYFFFLETTIAEPARARPTNARAEAPVLADESLPLAEPELLDEELPLFVVDVDVLPLFVEEVPGFTLDSSSTDESSSVDEESSSAALARCFGRFHR